NPAQGAVGAETKTAGQIAAERVCHDEQMTVWAGEIVGRLSMGDYLRDNLTYDEMLAVNDAIGDEIRSIVGTAFDLATPRTDSAERTAGEVEAIASAAYDAGFDASGEGWNAEYPENCNETASYRQKKREYLNGLATPAPSSPGVPDSVRDEGLESAIWQATLPFQNELRSTGGVTFMGLRNAVAQAVRTLLSAHPAGQSTGQGVETQRVERPYAYCCNMDPATCDCVNPNHGTAMFDVRKPAPDSPLTGPVEETVAVPVEPTDGMQQDGLAALEAAIRTHGKPTLPGFAATHVYRAMIAARPAAPEAQGAWRSQAADDVLAERRRQVEAEGWTPEHDDLHRLGEIAWAAAAYAESASRTHPSPRPPAVWPWRRDEWKPTTPRRNLVKAGALILAEIERLDRLPAPPSSGQGGR
ncbi:UNVERIFIED_CONTAM: hypothetical protein Q9R58_04190, partial [Methylobacteriaceae bacterium AG10]|nr:hypothetical protein [Methylobacteriaceae bacterium AG10]